MEKCSKPPTRLILNTDTYSCQKDFSPFQHHLHLRNLPRNRFQAADPMSCHELQHTCARCARGRPGFHQPPGGIQGDQNDMSWLVVSTYNVRPPFGSVQLVSGGESKPTNITGGGPHRTSLKNMSSSVGMIIFNWIYWMEKTHVPNHQPGSQGGAWPICQNLPRVRGDFMSDSSPSCDMIRRQTNNHGWLDNPWPPLMTPAESSSIDLTISLLQWMCHVTLKAALGIQLDTLHILGLYLAKMKHPN